MFFVHLAALLAAQSATPATGEATAQAPAAAPAAATPDADKPVVSPYDSMLAAARQVRNVHYEDSPDQQRRMAATDRSSRRFFNRAGATPEVYQEEWQLCRRVARWLASDPSQLASVPYVPTYGTSLAGAVVGNMLAAGLAAGFGERTARRDIRRQCLLARGWRMVEPDDAGRARIEAMTREARNAYFDRQLGAADVSGEGRVSIWGGGIEAGEAADGD